jgi:cytochrome c
MNGIRSTRIVAIALVAAAGWVAAPAAHADEALAKGKGCTACHANDKKVIGPAYRDVAKKYKGDAKAHDMLAGKIAKGGSGVWGPIPMPPNKVGDDEAKRLAAWILAM